MSNNISPQLIKEAMSARRQQGAGGAHLSRKESKPLMASTGRFSRPARQTSVSSHQSESEESNLRMIDMSWQGLTSIQHSLFYGWLFNYF